MSTKSRKILITGAIGQVGWELQRTLSTLGHITAIDRDELDLTDFEATRKFCRELRPDLIVNAAAYTAVDQAESEPDLARKLNAEVPAVLAEEGKRLKSTFITYSTDYVFDGNSSEPYTEESQSNPLSCYGRTKLEGDRAVESIGGAYFIFRISWIYGARGKNFLRTILRLASERTELRIVDDQVGAPTWCRTVAEATAQVVAAGLVSSNGTLYDFASEHRGVYNMVSSGYTSWCGFTRAILKEAGLDQRVKVHPIATSDYPLPAPRPKSSRLATEKLESAFQIGMPDWNDALRQVLESMNMSQETGANAL